MSGYSLLVPCYNAASFLPRLWETINAQTLPFDEVLCYDDASTDDTAQVARSLGARVISGSARRGPAHARNELWRAASHDWVHFHDADDLLEPDFLAMCAAATSDVDAVICDVDWIDESTRSRAIAWRYANAPLRAEPLSYAIENPIGGINGLYRRDALERINGFDERYSCWEDSDMHVRLAGSGARFGAVEKVLCQSLRRPGTLSDDQHRCAHARLAQLRRYAESYGERASASVARQAQNIAEEFLRHDDVHQARAALQLCAELGFNAPMTRSRLFSAVKPFLTPTAALRLQQQVRRIAHLWVRA